MSVSDNSSAYAASLAASSATLSSPTASALIYTTADNAAALAALDAERPLDPDTLRFIDQQLIGDTHQEVYYKGWADIEYVDKKLKPRLIVVSTFRLYVLKPGALGGLGIRQSFPLAHLRAVAPGTVPSAAGLRQVCLTFDDDAAVQKEFSLPLGNGGAITLAHARVDVILQAVLFATQSVRHGRPAVCTAALTGPAASPSVAAWLAGFKPPCPDAQDGLLAAYLAECNRVGIAHRVSVLDYFMTCFQLDDGMFDFKAALAFLDGKDCTKDVLAIVSALKYSALFTTLVCVDIALGNNAATALATAFDVPTAFTKLVLVNCRISRPSMTALGATLAVRRLCSLLECCN